MKAWISLACGGLLLLAGSQMAFGQAALERLEKRLKQGKPAARPEVQPGARPAAQPAAPAPAEDDVRPAPRDVQFEPGYLGAIADDRFDPGRGVRIVEAVADGPADEAGLREDDLIIGVNGRPVRKMDDLSRVIERSPAGAELTVEIERGGEKLRVAVTLGQRPPADGRRVPEFGRIPDEGEQPAVAGPAQPVLPNPAPAREAADRIRRLEERVQQLERRLQQLEEALRSRT